MSFPKAQIKRYYDDVSCAPPPGKYDPKLADKVKGVVLDKSQRFNTPKMESASSIESIDSACSSSKLPIFRTPSKRIPMKGPLSTPRTGKSRIPLPDKLHPCQISDNDNKRLIDEINELSRVHQNQLIEKNEEIAVLAEQVNTLNNELSKLMITQMSSSVKSEYEMEINKLRKQLLDLNSTLESNEQDYRNQVEELQSQLVTLNENLLNHISINKELEDSLVEKSNTFQEINEKINSMADNFNHQINLYVESINKVETVNKDLLRDYEVMMEILQRESNENLISKRSLMELQETVDHLKDDLNNAHKRCKMYEVVQTDSVKTINVLSKRLMECEVDVDKLNDVQRDLLSNKSQLEEQVKVLEDQVKDLSEENIQIKLIMETLQESLRQEAIEMRNQLLEKLETYKEFAISESEKQKSCILEKQNTIDMLLEVIETMKSKTMEMDLQLANAQARTSDYEDEVSSLKTTLSELETDFEEKIGAQKALFSQLTKDYDHLKKVFNEEKQEMQNLIINLEEDLEQKKHQMSLDQNKIFHLENITTEYDSINNKSYQLQNTLDQQAKHIYSLEKELMALKIQKEEVEKENSLLKKSFEASEHTLKELRKELKNNEDSNQKYLDEVIAELVLEKERVSELTASLNNLKAEKEFEHLECNKYDIVKLNKIIGEQAEQIQLFEYERLAQGLTFQDFLTQKDELLETINRQNREIAALSETADKNYLAKRDLEMEINRLNDEREQLKDSGNEDAMKVTCLEARIADLECRNRELNDIIGPFKSQLMQFEAERNFLLSKTENTEKELRAIELAHAKSLGHQNHKQKIKHVVDLKEKIVDLKKEVEKYRLENIKLRQQLTSQKPSSFANPKKNKENSKPSAKTERNKSPAVALKDRN